MSYNGSPGILARRQHPFSSMTRRNKAASRQRSGASRSRRSSGSLSRFLKALTSSALLSFAAASWLLHPDARAEFSLATLLSRLELPQPPTALVSPPTASVSLPDTDGYAQTQFAQCPHLFPQQHMPVVPARGGLRELCFDSFAILHDGNTKTPVFVAQRLNRAMLEQAKHVPRSERFYAEARLPAAERATLNDYRGSGYSRGHMAPAGDMHTPKSMAQSFSLANMVPQNQVQNAGAWSKIEQDTRNYIMRARGPVYVFTGPVYGEKPARIGEGGVAVPDYLFKVVHDAGTGKVWVHWQPNHQNARPGKPISYNLFVQRTGLHLLGTAG